MPALQLFWGILPVGALDTAVAFYAHVLATPGARVSPGRHYFDCGGPILACYDALADGDPAPVRRNPQYVDFGVDDLEAAYGRARTAGCSELDGIDVQPWG